MPVEKETHEGLAVDKRTWLSLPPATVIASQPTVRIRRLTMSTHIEWAEAARSKAACLSALEVNPFADDDNKPVLVVGHFGDTVMAFTGSTDELLVLLLDALNAVKSYECRPAEPGRTG
jgi:hypothetical protein